MMQLKRQDLEAIYDASEIGNELQKKICYFLKAALSALNVDGLGYEDEYHVCASEVGGKIRFGLKIVPEIYTLPGGEITSMGQNSAVPFIVYVDCNGRSIPLSEEGQPKAIEWDDLPMIWRILPETMTMLSDQFPTLARRLQRGHSFISKLKL